MVEFLESNATDAEAWCELADLYHSQGMNAQAIFCVEEALLIAPNAWNVSENDIATWDRLLISSATRPDGRD
jgi:ER membrane protein complex subunit 2